MKYWNGDIIKELKTNEIFVFGSNPEGRHGKGSAKFALNFGAKYGIGRGLQGNTYALVTKNLRSGFHEKVSGITYYSSGECSVSKEQIENNIRELYQCAKDNLDKEFLIVYQMSEQNLNGYSSEDIINMFKCDVIPKNIVFHESYKPFLEEKNYTFFFNLSSVFSNFHPSIFVVKDKTFISNEQFIMFCKAKLFNDDVNAENVLRINECPLAQNFINGDLTSKDIVKNHYKEWNDLMKSVKRFGRNVSPYNDEIWCKRRKGCAKHGARAKFLQNSDMYDVLEHTGNTFMVEASPYDKIWGIGLNESQAKNIPEDKWPGKNLLGEMFNELKQEFFINEKKIDKQMSLSL